MSGGSSRQTSLFQRAGVFNAFLGRLAHICFFLFPGMSPILPSSCPRFCNGFGARSRWCPPKTRGQKLTGQLPHFAQETKIGGMGWCGAHWVHARRCGRPHPFCMLLPFLPFFCSILTRIPARMSQSFRSMSLECHWLFWGALGFFSLVGPVIAAFSPSLLVFPALTSTHAPVSTSFSLASVTSRRPEQIECRSYPGKVEEVECKGSGKIRSQR